VVDQVIIRLDLVSDSLTKWWLAAKHSLGTQSIFYTKRQKGMKKWIKHNSNVNAECLVNSGASQQAKSLAS
jgi:hypothetical protein